ncbi:hypothetical protein [Aureibacter tunicatorum]|uniref:Uncharacterized protein n=1 Tax=Aureibacter tunicatorum TaxID=866807 RepID=A0AAE3XRH7_9BACT|nr:hypothetical protein [Aureibacter tunicatorum]MDR6241413.1 hypothetical protein [Aureibacter tunicatorum]BDD06742.1 hypothetical protein AUTU_42250 [Aureibacter tunicatorum]
MREILFSRAYRRNVVGKNGRKDALEKTPPAFDFDKGGVLQRAVGFEVEVSRYKLFRNEEQYWEEQHSGDSFHPYGLTLPKFNKGEVLLSGGDFEFQADHQGDPDSMPYLEIVTAPFGENSEGYYHLQACFDNIESIIAELVAKSQENGGLVSLSGLHGDLRVPSYNRAAKIMVDQEAIGNFQITAGVRLDQLRTLFEETIMSKEGLESSGVSKLNFPWRPIFISLISKVEDALQRTQMSFSTLPLSEAFWGLLHMIGLYTLSSSEPIEFYPKSFILFLARTDFASMYHSLSMDDKQLLGQNDLFVWKELTGSLLENLGLNNDDKPFFSEGVFLKTRPATFYNMMHSLKRKDWLENIPKGLDLLTQDHFPNPWRAYELESLGAMGSTMDRVGSKQQYLAPIFEFRSLMRRFHYRSWKQFAENSFKMIYQLNRENDLQASETMPIPKPRRTLYC